MPNPPDKGSLPSHSEATPSEKDIPALPVGPLPKNSQADAHELTPEEQMALFEKHLKENDWGHQPC